MRLVTFEISTPLGRVRRLGLWRSPFVLDANLAYAGLLARDEDPGFARRLADVVLPPDLLGYLWTGSKGSAALVEIDACWSATNSLEGPEGEQAVMTEYEIRLLAPLPRPNTLRDFSTFEQHQKRATRARGTDEVPKVWYEIPVYWKANPDNVVGPGADIHWPSYSQRLDYELEFAAVIGREGKNIAKENAERYIAGYTIFNDFSARDRQADETVMTFGPAKGKDFDTSKAIGPCLVTPDEFGSGSHKMTARVNGDVWSEGWTGDMYWSFPDLVRYVSESETVKPGDLLGSGACPTGCGLELNRWLKPGDVVELEVEGIGILQNRLVRA